ncbi:MAG: hypothetical protein PCFJNLEI_04233 [Verrucomicrobiae bacterium]|nr:hypothetical protein [Verrucomicrobiae bacterium]
MKTFLFLLLALPAFADFNWPDRRPIGTDFLCSPALGFPANPRGWFNDPKLCVTNDAGRAEFRQRLFARADEVIKYCRAMNAQGVIIWDLEGQEFPHAVSYIGDPRALGKLAPEMDAVADELFKKYRAAGLRVGLTVRPTRIIPHESKPGVWRHEQFGGVIDELADKIAYATNRWNCTLFYIDSNIWYTWIPEKKTATSRLITADEMRKLAEKFPAVLLIPEHESPEYWTFSAPYNELRGGYAGTPAAVRSNNAAAFSAIYLSDDPKQIESRWNDLVDGVAHGDILFFRAWYGDPISRKAKQIYEEAAQKGIKR